MKIRQLVIVPAAFFAYACSSSDQGSSTSRSSTGDVTSSSSSASSGAGGAGGHGGALGVGGMAASSSSSGAGGAGGAGGQGGAGGAPLPGAELWSRRCGGLKEQLAYAFAVDKSGDAIAAGYFNNTIDFNGNVFTSAGAQDVFVVKLDPAGNTLWSKHFGGVGGDIALAVNTDSAGDVLIAGSTSDTIDFGGGALAGDGTGDGFVVKLDPAGNHLWSKRFGGPDLQDALAVGADSAGNVIVIGYFYQTVDFGGGPLTSQGLGDLCVIKLGPDGAHQWSKRYGDSGNQVGRGVAADAAGNLFITGDFEGSIDFGGGPLVAQSNVDVFLAKLGPAGNHLWSKRFGAPPGQAGLSVTVDKTGSPLLSGNVFGSIDFGGGPLAGAGGSDAFVAKLDPAGNHVWSKIFGAAGNELGPSVATDGANNVLMTGYFTGTVDFGGGPLVSRGGMLDLYVLKMGADGSHLWSHGYGGPAFETGYGIGADAAGNVLVAGGFQGTLDFGGGALVSADAYDVFVAKLAP